MTKRAATDLADTGIAALGAVPSELEVRLVRAVAAMLAVASSPARAARSKSVAAPLPVSPQSVFQQVASSGCIICEPVDNRWFGRLGGLLKNIRVEQTDLDTLLAWFDAGGIKGWPTGKPGFTHFLIHLDKWLGMSREWDKRGRQTLGGKSSIGSAVDSPADMSAFSVPRLG